MRELRSPFPFDFNSSAAARSAAQVAQVLIAAGHQAVLAGGAVRDMLLGRQPKDFDIATDAHPKAVLSCFKHTRKVGIAFGVVLVTDFEETVEVATFRSDLEYKDGRRPEGVVFTNAENDAQRRDFTINGLFYDIETSEIIDYVGGRDDLALRQIRAIGEPALRFAEDYLRMLRAVRFAVTLNFDIHPETYQALKDYAVHLKDIAYDRIHEELRRTFLQERSDKALHFLVDSGLVGSFLPQAEISSWKFPEHAQYESGGDITGIFALLLWTLPKEALSNQLDQLRCTATEKQNVLKLSKTCQNWGDYANLSIATRKRRLREHQSTHLLYLLERITHLRPQLEAILKDLNTWTSEDLHPSWLLLGKDLKSLGLRPGPDMGQMLYELEEMVLEGQISNRGQLQEIALFKIREKTGLSPSD